MPASCLHAEENENSCLYDKQALTAEQVFSSLMRRVQRGGAEALTKDIPGLQVWQEANFY